MRILMVTATFPPSANGVAVCVKNTFEKLRKDGHEVYVLAPENKSAYSDPEGIMRYPSIPNPLVEDYPLPLLPLTPKILEFLNKTKFDLVHAHHPFYISFIADAISAFNNIPFVFTYHTRYGEYLKGGLKFIPENILDKIEKYTILGVLKRADMVLVPSKAIKKHLLNLEINSPIKIIPTGIPEFDTPAFSKMRLRQKYRIPVNKKILLCVSRIGVEKNIKLLIETIKLLPEKYFLVLAGTGPQLSELQKKARKEGVMKSIRFLGKIEHSKIPEIYCLADIFVFPSLTETQGLVLLEAEYFGLPVVAADCEVNREWVPGNCGVLSKDNPLAFMEAIFKAEKSSKEFSRNAKLFSGNFTLNSSVNKLMEVYSKLAAKGKKNKPKRYIVRKKLESLGNYVNGLIES